MGSTARLIFVIVMAVFIVGPLVWLGINAFSAKWLYPNFLPTEWTLSWWNQVIADANLLPSIRLSLIISPVVTVVSMIICLPAAYAFARMDFPGRRFLLIAIFATNAFPRFGLFIAMASLFYSLNLMGTFLGIVIVQLIGTIVFMTWIPAAAFAAIPRNLEEAARDAGAGPFRIFATITFPLAAPGILVAVILSFLAAFDEAQGTFLVGAPDFITMPTEMYSLIGHYPGQVSAVFSILLAIPSVLLLFTVRKHVMSGAVADGFQLR
ncbi:ABC transporter permease subunit [Lacisediminihabitans sp. G11-30]|uniref:ABC transporter permease subunit n=2 Tax=Lacisediminihabitans changchengi TaxID=2787634 RepID=A0A934SGK8_9MICO|nr:ABC transporter permease subunit [Lacisediminihabitans changchengi]